MLSEKTLIYERLQISTAEIVAFCKQWQIAEFALFGSILRGDFTPDSDVDVLLTFASDENWSLFDLVHLQQQLENSFHRAVDIAEKTKLTNPYRRHEILETYQVIYEHD